MYHIDSFFDVFTELWLDGGATSLPSAGAASVNLAPLPEPGTVTLLGIGLAAFGRYRKARLLQRM